MPDSFYVYHESGTSRVEFKRLVFVHYNIGCTGLVAEYAHMLLVAEGTPEAIIALGKELEEWGETYGNGRLVHTGVNTRREGLSRVLFINWLQWHFAEDGTFTIGRPPEIERALEAPARKSSKQRVAKSLVAADA
jgi:hypothetical protein